MTSVTAPQPMRPYALVLLTLIVAEATGAFEAAMMSSAVPKLIADFEITATDMGWAFSGFLLVAAASAVIGGRLGDLFGRKKVLIIVLLISVLGSVVSVAIDTFPAIIAGRSIQGVSAAVLPLIMGISREAVLPKRVPVTIAIVAGTVTLAGSLGFLVSGYLVEFASWHAIFVASAILAVIAAVLAALTLNKSPVTHVKGERIDILGGLLFVPAIALILFAVTSSRTSGWASPLVLTCLGIGIVVLAVWVWWELRTPKPLLDLRLLARPKYSITIAILAALAFGAIGGMQLVTPILLQSPTDAPVGLGLSPSEFGTLALVLGVLGFAFAPISGVIAGRAGAKRSMVIGIVILLVSFPGYFFFRGDLTLISLVMLCTAAGSTFALTAVPNLLAEAVPKSNMSEGVGLSVVARSVAQAVGISVFALVLASSVVPDTQLPELGAFGLTIAMATGGVLVALLFVLFVQGGKPKTDDEGEVLEASEHSSSAASGSAQVAAPSSTPSS